MQVIDPTTGEPGERYEPHDAPKLEEKLARAERAFGQWRTTPIEERSALLSRAAQRLRAQTNALADRMAHEMGKPVVQGRAEIEKCARTCDFYSEHAASFLAREPVATEAREAFVSHQPLGPVLAIMPWNFPFWQVFRHAAPSIAAGNVVLLKHAENVPGCALAIEELLREAGAPDGVFTTLLIDRNRATDVIRDRRIRAVTITGSTRAGRSVAATAGDVLKKSVLELGGSDPYLVLHDADLALAAEMCAKSRLINSGQSCIAAKRFIVVDAVREAWQELFVERLRAARMGDPKREDTEVGPQAREDLRASLDRQVRASIDRGARALVGGVLPAGRGFFYPPSALGDVRPGMPAFDEEIFGPVAAIVTAKNEDEAIALANASPYGLGAAVFTRDLDRARTIAESRLEAGCCFVNSLVQSDPRLPFGGVRESGYGRELARHGMLEFVNIKSVSIAQR